MKNEKRSNITFHYLNRGTQPYLGVHRENAVIEDLKWRRARSPSTTIVVTCDDEPWILTPICESGFKELGEFLANQAQPVGEAS